MPVIPPGRAEPYVPPDKIVRELEPGEPMERVSSGEKTMVIVVVVMLLVIVALALILPHTPFAE